MDEFRKKVTQWARIIWSILRTLPTKTAFWARFVWQKAGFYLSLAGCLLLLGGSAYYIRSKPPSIPQNRPMATAQPANAAPDMVQSLDDAQAAQPTPEPSVLYDPVNSREIITPHSPTEPLWSKTLFQWQPHIGIDIAAPLGEVVRAVQDGTVLRAYKDPLLGNIVELAHDDGLVTRYAGLMTLDMVGEGDLVSGGQAIGAVGNSAASESEMEAHLHFEAYRDGEFVLWIE